MNSKSSPATQVPPETPKQRMFAGILATRSVVTVGALVIASITVGGLFMSGEGVAPSLASVRDTGASCGWSSVRLPAVRDGELNAVAATGPSDVWSVGSVDGEKPLAMHWDGRSWRRIPIAGRGEFRAVAVFASDNAWAVGIGGGLSGLLAHWDGRRWTRVPTHPRNVSLSDVGGSGPDDVWAVGDSPDAFVSLHWNGVNWKRVPIPSFPPTTSRDGVTIKSSTLLGVAASASDDAWAVGALNGYQLPLIEHWDGKRWLVSRAPSAHDGLGRIAIISRDDIWAVSGPNGGALVVHWNGHRWSKLLQPKVSSAHALAAAPHGAVWIAEPLQRWNGRRWLRSPAPPGDYTLNGLSGIAATDVWAVGFGRRASLQPLALHYRCSK